jgi:hypothetical protein
MWKIRVFDKQGHSKGLLKLARYEIDEDGEEDLHWLHKRSWIGTPKQQHFETLLQWSGVDRDRYYLLIGFGPELTEDDYARALTSKEAATWLLAEGYELSDELQGEGLCSDSGTDLRPQGQPPLPPAQKEVWELLNGQALSAKEIAVRVRAAPVSEDSIRKRVAAMRKAGRRVENTLGLGYFRPDAPPQDLTGGQRESG